MLTPFLAYLLEHVTVFNLYVIESKQADESSLNRIGVAAGAALTWLTGREIILSRNLPLSEFQQKKALELYHKITDISPNKVNDQQVYAEILAKINSLITEVNEALVEKNSNKPTHLKIELLRFKNRFITAYKLFQDTGLIDKPFNGTPAIIFKTGLCRYEIGKRVYLYALQINYYQWTGWVHIRTYNHELSNQKDNLTRSHLYKKLDEMTLESIEGFVAVILQGNDTLVKNARQDAVIPIKVGSLSFNILLSWLYETSSLREEMTLVNNVLMMHKAQHTKNPFIQKASAAASSSTSQNMTPEGEIFRPISPTQRK